MKEYKIRLSDVYWAYTSDKNATMMPVIVNKEGSRYKAIRTDDIRTHEIQPTVKIISSSLCDESVCEILRKSIAQNLNIPTEQLGVAPSWELLDRYGRGIVPYFANRTLHKYCNYLALHKPDFSEIPFYTSAFCSKTTATSSEYTKLARFFENTIIKEWTKEHKTEIAEEEYEEAVKSF